MRASGGTAGLEPPIPAAVESRPSESGTSVVAEFLALISVLFLGLAVFLLTRPSASPVEDPRVMVYLGLWVTGTPFVGVLAFILALGARRRARAKGSPPRGAWNRIGIATMVAGAAYPLYLIAVLVWTFLPR